MHPLLLASDQSKEGLLIAGKILEVERLTQEEGLWLFEHGELGWLGMLAEVVRQRHNGNRVFYIRNFHIEPTNICVNHCRFCSFSHHFSKEKWELSVDQILELVKSQPEGVRELHITGAVHPGRDLFYYGNLLNAIRDIRPELHLKAYSAVEIDYMISKAGYSYKEGLLYLKECGLNSIPGGGAEIFDETIRRKIAATKSSSNTWLEIHETAHQIGISSNATMLYGHFETYAHRIDHLERLRRLQDLTHGFNAFIPLKFKNWNNAMEELPEVAITEDMRNYAVSRIYLDSIPHLKAYWPAIGKQHARISLSFGVDDMDGTINDSTKIYSLAGSEEKSPVFTVSGMQEFILTAGRDP
ncbi:MAG: CofH family radical SAM protein, partial [Bacteroidales bacterium]|nr:CofH family radical SAM protein [Bacteroidales bacterium]